MPGRRVIVWDAVRGLERENDPDIHRSNRAITSRGRIDCRVKPGNDDGGLGAGHRLTGLEV